MLALSNVMLKTNIVNTNFVEFPPDGWVYFAQNYIEPNYIEPNLPIMEQLLKEISLEQETLNFAGNITKMPRLVSWHGDEGKSYTYSRKTFMPKPWTPTMLQIKEALEKDWEEFKFNSCLVNYYRDGKDSIGLHADDEKGLGKNPIIASITFGARRTFILRKNDSKEKRKFELGGGDLLIMGGDLQHNWKHEIRKSRNSCNPRLNLTYRFIKEENNLSV